MSERIDASTLDIDKLGGMNDTHQNDNMPQPPDNMGMQTDQENDNMEAGSAVTATDYIYLGCSFVLLLVGIAIAAMYKRRKNGV